MADKDLLSIHDAIARGDQQWAGVNISDLLSLAQALENHQDEWHGHRLFDIALTREYRESITSSPEDPSMFSKEELPGVVAFSQAQRMLERIAIQGDQFDSRIYAWHMEHPAPG